MKIDLFKKNNQENLSIGTEKFLNAHPSNIRLFISKFIYAINQKFHQVSNSQWRTILNISIVFFLLTSTIIGFLIIRPKGPKVPKIYAAPSNSLYLYQVGNQDYTAKIGSKNTSEPHIVFTPPSGEGATFDLIGAKSTSGVQSGNSIIYREAFPDTNVTYTPLPNGIKEEFVISQPTSKAEYTFNLRTAAHPRSIDQSSLSPFFFDDKNKYQFHLEKPFAVDAKGNRTEDIVVSIRRSKEDLDLYQIQVTVSPEWLSAKNRAYPVTIDPTIVHDTTAEFAAGILNRAFDTGSGSVPSLETYYEELSSDTNTAGLWHMNEASGNALDSSGNSLSGVPTNTTVNNTSQKLGSAARSFDGNGDYLAVTHNSILNFGTDPFTIEAWIKSTSAADKTIIMKRTTAILAMTWVRMNTGLITFYTRNSSGAVLQTTSTITVNDGNWHHIGLVRSPDSVNIYIDGALNSSTFGGIVNSDNTENLIIGEDIANGATTSFDGSIDEIRISKIARSPQEIKMDASRRPYSVYTSDVVDFSVPVAAWNPLSWVETGVTTGNGETLKDSTSLIAQWNFNETSGTTASNAAGSCSTNCDLALTGFVNTASQDATSSSGWTSANTRWGAGALMLDKVDDVASHAHHASMNPGGSSISIDAWINSKAITVLDRILLHTGANTGYTLRIDDANAANLEMYIGDGSAYHYCTLAHGMVAGQWYYVAGTFNGTTFNLYVNGKSIGSCADTFTPNWGSQNLGIGGAAEYWGGVLDSIRIFGRAMTPLEIMSNYNAGNIEFETRVGSTTNPDDGTWEAWKPVTNETVIDSMDALSPTSCTGGISSDSGRVRIFVASGSFECTSSGNVEVLVVGGGGGGGTNMGGGGGGGGVIYNSSYSVTANTPITVTIGGGGAGAAARNTVGQATTTASNGSNSVFGSITASGGGKGGSSTNTVGNSAGSSGASGGGASGYNDTNVASGTFAGGTGTPGQGFRGGNQGNQYYSGGGGGAGGQGADGNFKANGGIGILNDILGPTYYWGGGGGGGGYSIVGGDGGPGGGGGGGGGVTYGGSGFFPGSPGGGGCTVCQANRPGGDGGPNTGGGGGGGAHYYANNKGGDGGSGIVIVRLSSLSLDTNTKTEGSASQKFSTTNTSSDSYTMALWHLDETSGSSAYLKSSVQVPFATGGTISYAGGYKIHTFQDTGTFSVNGSGNVEVLVVGGGGGGGETIGGGGGGGGVIKNTAFAVTPQAYTVTVGAGGAGGSDANVGVYPAGTKGGNSVFSSLTAIGGGAGAGYNVAASGTGGSAGGTGAGAGARAGYTAGQGNDGGAQGSTNAAGGGGGAGAVGAAGVSNVAGNGGAGLSDSISGTATYYGAGGGGGARNSIPGTPGTGGTGGGGNGGVSTAGVEGLDGSGAGGGGGGYVSDLAGGVGGDGIVIIRYPVGYSPITINNDGTPTGTAFTGGIIGGARTFNGSSDVVTITDTPNLWSPVMTVEAWAYPTAFTSGADIYNRRTAGNVGGNIIELSGTAGVFICYFYINGAWNFAIPANYLKLNQWNYVACTYDGTTIRSYVNGMADTTTAVTGIINNPTTPSVLMGKNATSANYFSGKIDEVKLSSIPKTAAQISEAYRLNRDKYLNKTITSTDLSGKNSIPFWVAADRPGTYLQATVGESNYANYLPDSNTKALYHMDEKNQYISDSFPQILATKWAEIDVAANKISAGTGGLVLAAGSTAAWDAALISQSTFSRTAGQTLYFKFTTGASVVSPNYLMLGWAQNNTGVSSYTNISHGLEFAVGSFYVYQDGALTGGPYGSGYVANTTYEIKITLSSAGIATYSVKGGVYTNWTTLLAADNAKTNNPLRVQIAQYQHTGTINEFSVIPNESILDSSINNNTATNAGVISSQGKIGLGGLFNGASDFMDIRDSDSLSFGNGGTDTAMSISTWAYPTSLAGANTGNWIVNKRDGGSNDEYQLVYWQGQLYFTLFTTSANSISQISSTTWTANQWYHIVATYDGTKNLAGMKIYVNGVRQATIQSSTGTYTGMPNTTNHVVIGKPGWANANHFAGIVDELRIDGVVRTADEIRQAFEVGQRTHPITIDFASAISHTGPLSNSSDLTFTLMATPSGTTNAGDNIYDGDKIIVRENVNGTEYIAQGTVDSVNISTGATTVSSWDAASTFPTGGFTPNANVFKWQREYWPIDGSVLDTHLNAITNLTLKVTDGNEGRNIWFDDFRSNSGFLTTPGGSTITSSTGYRYLQYRAINTSVNPAVSATLSAVTMDYTPNVVPNTPTLDAPTDTAISQILSTVLKTTATDTNSDYLRYKIQICIDSGMTTRCQTFDQTSSQTGWSGQNSQTSTAYTSGTQAIYTIQTPLSYNTTYYWRSYAIDPIGANSWGATQGTPYSFTTNVSPNIPTLNLPVDTATGVLLSPALKTTTTDANSDYLKYKIEFCENQLMTINCQTFNQVSSQTGWSGQNTQTSTAYTSNTQSTYTLQTVLTPASTYFWRSYAIDPAGTNAFSSTQGTPFSFTTNWSPEISNLNSPSNGAANLSLTPQLVSTTSDHDLDYLRWKIKICTDLNMSLNCQTFNQVSSQTGWSGQDVQTSTAYGSTTPAYYTLQSALNPGTTYFWVANAIDPAGTNIFGSIQAVPFSFTTLPNPTQASTCRVEKNNTNTQLTVRWTDNSTTEGGYQVWRIADGGIPTQLGSNLAANTSSYVDSTVLSNHTYGYLVRNFQIDGANTLYSSWCTTATSNLNISTGGFTIF